MKVLAIIPARSGSKTLPDKNVKLLGDHPLLSFSVAAAVICKNIDRVIISTDSIEYADIAMKYGAECPFLRPKNISKDQSTDAEFFKHAFEWLVENENYTADLVVHLRPTTPLREIDVIEKAVDFMKKNQNNTALRSASKSEFTPYKMFKQVNGSLVPFLNYKDVQEFYNLPRQTFEDTYIPNGYVDILRPEILLKTKLLHGINIKLWETVEVPDIDAEKDFEFAERKQNDVLYNDIKKYLHSKVG